MGADLIIASAWIKKNKLLGPEGDIPNVAKAEDYIAKLAKTPFSKWPEVGSDVYDQYETPEEAAKVLDEDLDVFHSGTTGDRRDVSWIVVGPYMVYLTGGMSWGDPPTDAFDSFDRLSAAGVLDVMGFFKP